MQLFWKGVTTKESMEEPGATDEVEGVDVPLVATKSREVSRRKRTVLLSAGAASLLAVCIAAVVFAVVAIQQQNARQATLLIFNATPHSVAIRGNRIVAIGSAAEALLVGAQKVIDAGGRLLLPGLTDCHAHPLFGSLLAFGPVARLGMCRNVSDLIFALGTFAAAHDDAGVCVGMEAPYLDLNRTLLDKVLQKKPVVVLSYDLHSAWANTLALDRAGLLFPGANCSEELVPRDADGRAIGVLKEPASYGHLIPQLDITGAVLSHRLSGFFALKDPRVPNIERESPLRDRLLEMLHSGLESMAAQGITSVHVMDGDRQSISLFDELAAEGRLPVRVIASATVLPGDNLEEALIADRVGVPKDLVRVQSAKFWLDGVIETKTAFVLDAYPGVPAEHFGAPLWERDALISAFEKADKAKLHVVTHAVGDAAVRMALDCFEEVFEKQPSRDRRWQIEHIELVSSQDAVRFSKLGVVAGMQPLHAICGPDWTDNVPPSRFNDTFAWKTLLRANTTLVWGSDWPVASTDALAGILELTTDRVPIGGASGSDQRVPLEDAVWGYTEGGAFTEFSEAEKGSIAVGMLADLVLLSESTISHGTRPILTICNGKVTFDSEN